MYSIRVHPVRKPNEPCLLGDFNDAGVWLGEAINEILTEGVYRANADESRSVTSGPCVINGSGEVRAMFSHGQSGVVASITDRAGDEVHRQEADQTHSVSCASLFYLPRTAEVGWWASHANNGRSAKSLTQDALIEAFREEYPDYRLKIKPTANLTAFKQAIEKGLIESVTLSRLTKPHDRADAAEDKWVEGDDGTLLQLKIKNGGTGAGRLKAHLLRQFVLDGDQSAFSDIIEFGGLHFDEAKVEVELPGGGRRTFNIEERESGFAYSSDLEGLDIDGGEPTPESLFEALRQVLVDAEYVR